jgi:CBS domain-containing protein
MSIPPVRLDAPPETLDDDPPLSSLMTHRLVGITPDADVHVALRLLATSGVRHLPVLADGRCLGMVCERDVVRHLAGPDAPLPTPVARLCRPAPVLGVRDRRSTAAAEMQVVDIDAVLVIENGRLVGIVTATDLVRSLGGATRAERDQAAP